MRLLIANLLLVLAFAGSSQVSARRTQDVTVKINTETAAKGGLKIRFASLVEDSRCPTDTNCVWAGNAKITVRVTRNGRSKLLTLNTMERGAAPVFAGYRFKLAGLTPEPRSNIRINRNGYEATIEITKVK
jgi:hypothetical protein